MGLTQEVPSQGDVSRKGSSGEEAPLDVLVAADASSSPIAAEPVLASAKEEEAVVAQEAAQGGGSGQNGDEGLEESADGERLRLLQQRERQSSGCSALSTSSPQKQGSGGHAWHSMHGVLIKLRQHHHHAGGPHVRWCSMLCQD